MSAYNMGNKLCREICVCAECSIRTKCAGCIGCDPDLEPHEETKDSYGATKECYNKDHLVYDYEKKAWVKV